MNQDKEKIVFYQSNLGKSIISSAKTGLYV